jgi:uncharacterized membrane protein
MRVPKSSQHVLSLMIAGIMATAVSLMASVSPAEESAPLFLTPTCSPLLIR